MSDYKNGKIYKLVIADMVYIGSTAHPLSRRFGWHKKDYRMWVKKGDHYTAACELFKMGLPVIELIELYPCDSKQELRDREGYHQRINTGCVNKNMAGRTKSKYREENRAKAKEQRKAYHAANKTRIVTRRADYNKANKAKQNMKRESVIRTKRLTAFIQKHIILYKIIFFQFYKN